MFVIDDSGSMDWEFMTTENGGTFQNKYFNFGLSDNAYSDTYIVSGTIKKMWQARWAGYNRMYYNPGVNYVPWPNYSNASTTAPRSNPVNSTPTLTLSAEYDTVRQEIIVHNESPRFSKSATGWADSGSYTTALFGTYFYAYNNNGSAWARWTPDIPVAGTYTVYAFWKATWDRTTNASYTIRHNGIDEVVYRNQQINDETWVSLGSFYFAGGGDEYVRLNATVSGNSKYCAEAVKFEPSSGSTISIKNAHYYTYSASENVPYLVVLSGGINYYRFTYNRTYINEAGLIQDSSPPDDIVPKNEDGSPRTYAQELQNFANWFSFYRRRELTAKAAIARVIKGVEGVNVGLYSIWNRVNQSVLPVKVTIAGTTYDNSDTLLALLYGLNSSDGTPLRAALKAAGEYFAGRTGGIGPCPYASAADGGECQQSFSILITDGFWNGTVSGIGNEDGSEGAPYADSWSGTLADVAMKYYKTDLSSTLLNLVPTNFPDMATWQHMVTYGVSFGLHGTLDPYNYDLYNSDPARRVYPSWPNPMDEADQERIDDLWHASVNGRGKFLSASNPQDLIDSLLAVMQNVMARVGSGASISVNGEEFRAGSVIYQASYSTDRWTGDVKAYSLNQTTGAAMRDTPLWSARALLDTASWDSGRVIATYDTTNAVGIPFRYAGLSNSLAQRVMLDADPATAEAMLNYLRGDSASERANGGSFRDRSSKLGDIVHSSPTFYKDMIYVGGNDGMLHALNATTGEEVFAYVPGLLFPELYHLTSTAYSHRYYVDLTPYAASTGTADLLVGGLGKGGRGYYCLDITNAASIASESTLAARVKWEFPRASTDAADIADMGYSFSEAYIVKANSGSWVVIFGNGYASPNEHAVLFVLDAVSGTTIAKIDTGVGSCNGLSSPTPIDVNMDNQLDYVYAGDLKGNLWKFDLTDASPANWKAAYFSGGTPMPLFQAKDASGSTQPITTKPDVMLHCDPSLPGYMVVFGTGKYLGLADFVDTSTQTIYGIWDYGDDADDSEYLGAFTRPGLSHQDSHVTLLAQTEIYYAQPSNSTHMLRVLSNNEATWATEKDSTAGQNDNPSKSVANNAGWYFDLPLPGERVIRNPMIRSGKAIIMTSVPKRSPCEAGGDSIFMEMDACNGGRLYEAQFDINGDAKIDENDMIPITDPSNTTGEPLAPTGIRYPVMMYPPKIIRMPDETETKYFSTAAGNILMLREEGEERGIYYWRCVE